MNNCQEGKAPITAVTKQPRVTWRNQSEDTPLGQSSDNGAQLHPGERQTKSVRRVWTQLFMLQCEESTSNIWARRAKGGLCSSNFTVFRNNEDDSPP